MSASIIYLTRHGKKDLSDLSDILMKAFQKQMHVPELVINEITELDGHQILLLMLEKYYMRTSSMTAVTIHGIADETMQKITVIGTGGGSGAFNISWGANKDFAMMVVNVLKEEGFALVSED